MSGLRLSDLNKETTYLLTYLFESKQCSQASLIKSINPACIHLGNCPAFRSV